MEGALPAIAILGATMVALSAMLWLTNRYRRISAQLTEARAQYADAICHLHTQAELFQVMFDSAPECVKLQGLDGCVMRMNAAGLALLEAAESEKIVGKSVYSVIAPEYHQAYRELTDRVFAGKPASMEFELVTFRGRRRWLETHAVPLRDQHSQVAWLLAITRDIDDRKRMTRQLEEQRNRLQTIIESEPECVKLQARSGVITEMNPAGLTLLGAIHSDQVIGRSIYEFLDQRYHSHYRTLTEKVFAGLPDSMEFQVNAIDGTQRWLETHAAPLRDAGGRITALLAITRDIDERKRNEEKLRRQRNELAHVCRLGTLGELAPGLAHELNQPLCAISSYAESAALLNNRPNDKDRAKIDEILHKVVHEAERASGIIRRLRDFVRKRSPQPGCNRVEEMIGDTVDMVEKELKRRAIRLDLYLPEDLPQAWVDRVQTEQVLLNLLNNAMQAVQEKQTQQRALAITVTHTASQLLIDVRDYANGVPDSLRPRLFTPFFTTKPEGIGMGLALSRSIAEANGGHLSYLPANPGSVFRLTLPVATSSS